MLPPGPQRGVLAQTVAMHRDPLGTLRAARSRCGDVFAVRLATARPIVPDEFRPERWGDGATGLFLPFGGGARRCLGEHLAKAYVDALVRPILRHIRLRPLWPTTERMVLRGTILVPHRSAPMRAARR